MDMVGSHDKVREPEACNVFSPHKAIGPNDFYPVKIWEEIRAYDSGEWYAKPVQKDDVD